ncbi:putative Heat shock protein DnaJ, cysteine-rich domain superfamily [Dioscorea sansibarensis]
MAASMIKLFATSPSTAAFPSHPPGQARAIGAIGSPSSKRVVAVSAVGDVSSDSTTYLIAGAAAVALIGTAFPVLFSRKDICPECDGAGFIRKAGVTLRANAARKDQPQIVCPNCNGLGKLGQIDK